MQFGENDGDRSTKNKFSYYNYKGYIDYMETIRQVIQVEKSRQIQITLPESIEPGLVEILIVLQPVANQSKETVAPSKENQINLFGFLPRRVEPLLFQKEIRKEWGE